jgi:hypothetical protein
MSERQLTSTLELNESPSESLPYSLLLELTVSDAEVIAALWDYPDGAAREEFALRALRIGVLALKQAQGQIDAGAVRHEGERLLQNVGGVLDRHAQLLHERMTAQLKEYFDPQSGRFQERVERLIKQDGDLETVLRRNIGEKDSELCKTLASHIGDASPLMKVLDPSGEAGLTAGLQKIVEARLQEQREHILKQFSLDETNGALCRFLAEVKKHYDGVSGDLTTKIDKAVGEFSLDDENSALSRLVGRVKVAQETITREFSLDEKESALSRLRGELVDLLEKQSKANREFQEEVKVTIRELQARKAEAALSTRHGVDFEQSVIQFIEEEARRTGDIAQATGNTTGRIKHSKVGDAVLELGPESAAPAARIVFEAKEVAGYDLTTAREEIEVARKNRDAQVGVFVFSRLTAPEALEPLVRYGHDIVVIWKPDDPASDIYLRVAITLARALCVREQRRGAAESADLEQIDKAILEIEKRAGELDQIKSGAESIIKSANKILDRQRLIRESLDREVESLRDRTAALRDLLNEP